MAIQTSSWGRFPQSQPQQTRALNWRDDNYAIGSVKPMLAYGNGRSYGDVCQNDNGLLLATRGLSRYIAFDPETGVLECEAGVLLSEILALVVPQGWFLPVVPGTKFVTVGGAIANDVHGKNHHQAGTFGCQVLNLRLQRSDGEEYLCSPDDNHELFAATVGGLGLTGVIKTATIQLRRISSREMQGQTIKFANLDEFFALSEQTADDYEYVVAWVDCLASGDALGRGHFIAANHAPESSAIANGAEKGSRLAMPVTPPISMVNAWSLRAFNTLYYHRQQSRVKEWCSGYDGYFFPLDGIANWNRMYGPKGFVQYQCVIPESEQMQSTVADILAAIADHGLGSFLAVLKCFGTKPSPGMLSFPRPGTTLALDFPLSKPDKVRSLLKHLDQLVLNCGGRLYAAKDALSSDRKLLTSDEELTNFLPWVDPAFSSSMARRTGLLR